MIKFKTIVDKLTLLQTYFTNDFLNVPGSNPNLQYFHFFIFRPTIMKLKTIIEET